MSRPSAPPDPPEPEERPELAPWAGEDACRLIGAGDGSVMVYCQPCRRCLCPRAATLNAAAGLWEEHTQEAHEPERKPCALCGRFPQPEEQHRMVYAVGQTGEDAEEVCVGADRRQLDYLPAPDPWSSAPTEPPPF